MKQRESYLDQELSRLSQDRSVHVVHSANQNMTVSYIIVNHDTGPTVVAHTAKRNPKDNFSRRIGRLISKGRLLAGKGRRHVHIDYIPQNAEQWRALDRKVLGLFT